MERNFLTTAIVRPLLFAAISCGLVVLAGSVALRSAYGAQEDPDGSTTASSGAEVGASIGGEVQKPAPPRPSRPRRPHPLPPIRARVEAGAEVKARMNEEKGEHKDERVRAERKRRMEGEDNASRERREALRERAHEMRAKMEARFKERQKEAKERLERRREVIVSRLKDRLESALQRVKQRLAAAVRRLEKLVDKLEARIGALEERFGSRGFDATQPRQKLAEARAAIAHAGEVVAALPDTVSFSIPDEVGAEGVGSAVRATVVAIRTQFREALDAIRAAHRALVEAVKATRVALGAVAKAQVSGSVQEEGSSEESVAPSEETSEDDEEDGQTSQEGNS